MVVTTIFDANGQIVQWYIDIRSDMGLGADQVPWFDDLYLDLVVSPNGKFELLDADELQDAFDNGVIDCNLELRTISNPLYFQDTLWAICIDDTVTNDW